MFIAALLTTAKTGKETECPSRDEWVKKLWYLDTTGYYSTLQKKEAMPSAAAYMQLHNQTERQTPCDIAYMESHICSSIYATTLSGGSQTERQTP